MTAGRFGILEEAAKARTRASWNDRLTHWERPASDTEEAKIERAARMARFVVAGNAWLSSEDVTVFPQGSYFNNTNVRLEADMDLRVMLPGIKTMYMRGVEPAVADDVLGYFDTGRTFSDIVTRARAELTADFVPRLGADNIDATGNKAIAVKGLDGSRADCDLVPAFRLDVVFANGDGTPFAVRGVAILGRDSSWTLNFPEQHRQNGINKRNRTAHRYKKNVRMLKRLNYELCEAGDIPRRLPGFLIESLVYGVEDHHFLVEADDRYWRVLRVLGRVGEQLTDDAWIAQATEVNEIKFLFHSSQGWDRAMVVRFATAAIRRLTA